MIVGDLDAFQANAFLLGESPQKWRSGIKHDAAAVMELTRSAQGLLNGLGEQVDIETHYLFPLLKGSDVAGDKPWREKFMLVTQQFVGERTDKIRENAPKTWHYLMQHAHILNARASTIYQPPPIFDFWRGRLCLSSLAHRHLWAV